MFEFEVSVSYGDEPPEDGKGQPAQDETQREDEDGPAPLDVHHGGEDVGQVAPAPLGNVALHNVAFAVLEHDALAHPPRTPPARTVPVSNIQQHLSSRQSFNRSS